MKTSEKRELIHKTAIIGLMSALIYAGNLISIPLPYNARIHVGNSMCLLAGLLFGGLSGGLSSGIGGMLFDLFDPRYITSAPITFFTKFAMGWTTGFLNRSGMKSGKTKAAAIAAAIIGQIVYIILYLSKTFIAELIKGNAFGTAIVRVGEKAVSSSVNGVIAVVVAVPLYFALKSALAGTPIGRYTMPRIKEKAE